MRISDWSSDVCSSDLLPNQCLCPIAFGTGRLQRDFWVHPDGVHLPGAAQSVAIPPELGAVGLNAQEEAAAIPKLVHLGLGLRCFHLARREKVECCECHVYNASKSARYTLHYTHEHWICPAVSSAQKIFNPLKTWT